MMQIMIVDDEVEIREGLRCLIEGMPGAGSDFTVTSACEGAEEALEALSRHRVDVLITDIRMARIDGLRLTEMAKSLYPELKVIMLSGYSDFAYTQRAIQLSASDYLLKPVKKSELEAVLHKLHGQCAEQKEAQLLLDAEEFGRRSAYACAAIIVVDATVATAETAAATTAAATTAAGPTAAGIAAVASGAPPHEAPMPGLLAAAKEAVIDLPDAYVLRGFATRASGNIIIGVYGQSPERTESAIAEVCARLSAYAARLGQAVSIGISETAGPEPSVHALYLHACMALSNRLLQRGDGGSTGKCGGDSKRTGGIWRYAPRSFDESRFHIELNRIEAAWEMLDFPAIYEEVRIAVSAAARERDIALLIWTINTIIFALNDKVRTFNHFNESIPYDLSGILFKVLWCRSLDDLHSYLLGRVKELLATISPERREGQIVFRAKQYIQQHMHEQISLSDISSELCVSVSYLSRMFREKTGVTFLEYLTSKRIESAKELLAEPGVKVYEVAEKTGYGSWKHFSRTFKEVTGYTPADYRQNACQP